MSLFFLVLSATAVNLVSVLGYFVFWFGEEKIKKIIWVTVSFAVGAILGNIFLHLLPTVYEAGNLEPRWIGLWTMAGMLTFFVIEKAIHHRHHLHSSSCHHQSVHPMGYMSLAADGLHNLIDGVLMGSAYAVSIPLGVSTSIAILFHEIPQEIGDYGILLHAGFSKKKAMFYNFFAGSLCFVGALAAYFGLTHWGQMSWVFLPFAAGSFIYLVGADLIPTLLEKSSPAKSVAQFVLIVLGIVLMIFLTGHSHE